MSISTPYSPVLIDWGIDSAPDAATNYFCVVTIFTAVVGRYRVTEAAYQKRLPPAPAERLALYINRRLTAYCEAFHE